MGLVWGFMVRAVLALLVVFASFIASPTFAAKRAFVIGVDKYDNLGKNAQLQRAVNDAQSVATVLLGLGYQVTHKQNLKRSEFNANWQTFLNSLNPSDEVALYYSGHGIEIDGQNYLLPRNIPDVKYGREAQIKRESISLQDLLLDLREKKPRVSLIILDACRDHPLVPPEFKSVGPKGGLANIHAPQGTFIMYSAGAGETALDRLPENDPDKVNSVYTRKLLALLKAPGLSLPEMAARVRSEVYELAKSVPHLQRPAYYDGVIGRYCVAGCSGGKLPPRKSTAPPREPKVTFNTRPVLGQKVAVCDVVTPDITGIRRIREGALFCGASKSDVSLVRRVLPYRVIFSINGKDMSCNPGELCSFPWSTDAAPYFRVQRISSTSSPNDWRLVLVKP